jgi:serine/threonine-protein kinase RsbW
VRDFVGDFVRDEPHAEDALLLASELATNAVRYGIGDFTVAVVRLDAVLRVEVCDRSPVRPTMAPPRGDADDGGRGLRIVDAVALEWGTEPRSAGKAVWFTLPR